MLRATSRLGCPGDIDQSSWWTRRELGTSGGAQVEARGTRCDVEVDPAVGSVPDDVDGLGKHRLVVVASDHDGSRRDDARVVGLVEECLDVAALVELLHIAADVDRRQYLPRPPLGITRSP